MNLAERPDRRDRAYRRVSTPRKVEVAEASPETSTGKIPEHEIKPESRA